MSSDPTPLVSILTGSPNDLPVVRKAEEILQSLGVPCEVRVLSAHRTPDLVVSCIREDEARGVRVFIACAGLAAHLAGAVAANTLLPVIGVPLQAGSLGGLDALLSTVQMPPGVPVATVGIDNATNAALLAARIVALNAPEVRRALQDAREAERRKYSTGRVPADP